MPIGKFSDPEWKMSIPSMTICMVGLLLIPTLTVEYGILRPLALGNAAPREEELPPAWGFWLRGNMSLFTPGLMNRTDLNESSGTYLHWTPPPGARSHLHALVPRLMTIAESRAPRCACTCAYQCMLHPDPVSDADALCCVLVPA